MITTQTLYRLLYLALIDLRSRAVQKEDQVSYALTHMMHRVPLMLGRLSAGEIDVNAIMNELKAVSVEVGADAWLEAHLEQIACNSPEASEVPNLPPHG